MSQNNCFISNPLSIFNDLQFQKNTTSVKKSNPIKDSVVIPKYKKRSYLDKNGENDEELVFQVDWIHILFIEPQS